MCIWVAHVTMVLKSYDLVHDVGHLGHSGHSRHPGKTDIVWELEYINLSLLNLLFIYVMVRANYNYVLCLW